MNAADRQERLFAWAVLLAVSVPTSAALDLTGLPASLLLGP
ncbi:AbrB family transcriptional regulator, partial [Endobacter medicaginis]|nr:AbrB family transcriptional regulator [Endobacter medicaginis]